MRTRNTYVGDATGRRGLDMGDSKTSNRLDVHPSAKPDGATVQRSAGLWVRTWSPSKPSLRPGSPSDCTGPSEASAELRRRMRFLPEWQIRESLCLQDVLCGARLSEAPRFPGATSRLSGLAHGTYGICAGQRGHGSNVQAATGGREPRGVVYTPARSHTRKSRDEAVAASRLLLNRRSTSRLEPLKTCADLLRKD